MVAYWSRLMEGAGLLLLGVIAGAVAMYARRPGDDTAEQRFRRVKRWPIDDLPDNETGRLVGRVEASTSLEAPLSGRRCVVYRVIVEEFDGVVWNAVIFEARSVPFVFVDDPGRALVDATHSELLLDDVLRHHASAPPRQTERERAFLERHYFSGAPGPTCASASLRFREAIIAHGDQIAVVGYGTREPDPARTPADPHRGSHPSRLRVTGTLLHPVRISNQRRLRR